MADENSMRRIVIEKVTVNMGVGQGGEELKKAKIIMEKITGAKPIETKCRVKQPKWELRPGIPIGVKVTLRKNYAIEFLKRVLAAKNNTLKRKNFDMQGNFGVGIKEHIDLQSVKYDPKFGIRGFDMLVTLKRAGYRVKKRKICKQKIGKSHAITRDQATEFMKKEFGVEIE